MSFAPAQHAVDMQFTPAPVKEKEERGEKKTLGERKEGTDTLTFDRKLKKKKIAAE